MLFVGAAANAQRPTLNEKEIESEVPNVLNSQQSTLNLQRELLLTPDGISAGIAA